MRNCGLRNCGLRKDESAAEARGREGGYVGGVAEWNAIPIAALLNSDGVGAGGCAAAAGQMASCAVRIAQLGSVPSVMEKARQWWLSAYARKHTAPVGHGPGKRHEGWSSSGQAMESKPAGGHHERCTAVELYSTIAVFNSYIRTYVVPTFVPTFRTYFSTFRTYFSYM